MPNPASLPTLELPAGFETENHTRNLDNGNLLEHYRVNCGNGYYVSLARSAGQPEEGHPKTVGYDDGLWEAALVRDIHPDDLRTMFGFATEVASDLEADYATDDVDGWKVVGNLDNDKIEELVKSVAARDRWVPPVPEDGGFEDLISSMFAAFSNEDEENDGE